MTGPDVPSATRDRRRRVGDAGRYERRYHDEELAAVGQGARARSGVTVTSGDRG